MKSRTIAIAGSLAALAFAATPVVAIGAPHHAKPATSLDRSRDIRGVRHVDKSPDRNSRIDLSGSERNSVDRSVDVRDF